MLVKFKWFQCVKCGHKGSVKKFDLDTPTGMSAVNDGYDYSCGKCHKLYKAPKGVNLYK